MGQVENLINIALQCGDLGRQDPVNRFNGLPGKPLKRLSISLDLLPPD
jgi:hypothetical protein